MLGTLQKLIVLLRAAAASTMNIVDRNGDISIIDASVKNKWRWDFLSAMGKFKVSCVFIYLCAHMRC